MRFKHVLFVCTGNSARSQMAEAKFNHHLSNQWQVFSAGTASAGYVHPAGIAVLAEIGIEHQGRSKNIEAIMDQRFDLVVTVCDVAALNCPVWLGLGVRKHMGFPDPAQAQGSEQEVVQVFRQVRDVIVVQIPALLGVQEDSRQI